MDENGENSIFGVEDQDQPTTNQSTTTLQGKTIKNMDKKEYKQHKMDSILYCEKYLDEYKINVQWKDYFQNYNKKKDDLADSFLQGIWYIKKHQ